MIEADSLQLMVPDLLSVSPFPEEGRVACGAGEDPLAGVVAEGAVAGRNEWL